MAQLIVIAAGVFLCTGTVLDAYYKTDEQEKKLVVKLGLLFSDINTQYVWETMCIEHNNLQSVMIGRNKAYKLALACGLPERPEDASVLIGKKVQVTFGVDSNGNIRIKKYDKLNESRTVKDEGNIGKDLF